MARIRPFCALRYSPARIKDLGSVLAPPYDVIDPDEQKRLYQASPHNIVRLILGTQSPSDTDADNRYTRARRDFHDWCAQGILRCDPQSALYLIEHTFCDQDGGRRSRLGFTALLELDEPLEQVVYRHEETLAAPKADRTKLLEALPANLSPIFCVYPDEGAAMQSWLQEVTRRLAPTVSTAFKEDAFRLWVVAEPRLIQDLTRRLAPVAVLIADGHHRFEVAYAQRARSGAVMAHFVSMADPALVVHPIHRVVRHERPWDPEALRALCAVDPAPDLASLMPWLKAGHGVSGRFGCYDGRSLYRVAVRAEPQARWLMASPAALPLAGLDVSLLHDFLLPALGGGAAVHYTPHADEAIQTVSQGHGCTAWLLKPTPLPQVYALAAQGLRLPPKSTYFSPKVFCGLTINPLDVQ